MSNDTEIRPALSADEWKYPKVIEYRGEWEIHLGLFQGDFPIPYRESGYGVTVSVAPRGWTARGVDEIRERRHALAALALHGQPFGFTREDVTALLYTLDDAGKCGTDEQLRSIAERIAALLPPEGVR